MIAKRPEFYEVKVGRKTVLCYSNLDIVYAVYKKGGQFEPRTMQEWARLCEGGGTIIDVGSYVGLFGIAAAKYGCQAFMFEPMRRNRERIIANCELNKVKVYLDHRAVSDQIGVTDFYYSAKMKDLSSGSSLVPTKHDIMQVETVTLDSLEFESCKALKIDVEGADARVLRGARALIAKYRPPIIIEVLTEKAARDVGDEISQHNYRVAEIMDVRNWLMIPA